MGAEAAEEALLKTPLYDTHVEYKGKIVSFAGYLLPAQYEADVIDERMAVRTKCGLFGVSHMGEMIYKGPDTFKNLNMLLTNDYTVMAEDQTRCSPICSEQDGVVDDLTVYKVRDDRYFIVVNTVNKSKDYTWMRDHQSEDVVLEDIFSQVTQLTPRGPKAIDMFKRMTKEENIPEKHYICLFGRMVDGMRCIISEAGYTGEDGVEIYLAPEGAPKTWELLMETGKGEGPVPCGLGARDTLRLGVGMPLYGRETDDTISPKGTGLGIFAKMDKDDFIGKQAIQNKKPLTRKCAGLKITGHGIIREHQRVCIGGQQVDMTASGTHCPFLGYPVAMALVDIGSKDSGTALEVDIGGRRVTAEVVRLPFYKRQQFSGYKNQDLKI